MRVVIAAMAIALMTLPALAQTGGGGMGGGGGGGRGHHGQAKKAEEPKKKTVDDKDYKAALGRIPEKKIDPWADRH